MTDSRGTGLQQWTKKNSAKFSEHISDFETEDKKMFQYYLTTNDIIYYVLFGEKINLTSNVPSIYHCTDTNTSNSFQFTQIHLLVFWALGISN